jgi:hypothetical protein
MMMMVVVLRCYQLRLRSDRSREAEDNEESEQNFLKI